METTPNFSIFALQLVIIGLIGLVATGLWLWMLIDCISNEPSTGNDRLIWVLVIALTGWIGALIYMFARRPQRISQYGQ